MIAESFERIHRSNLIGMGVLPLQFAAGESVARSASPARRASTSATSKKGEAKSVTVTARADDGAEKQFEATVRLDTPNEVDLLPSTAASCRPCCAS